MRVLDRVPYICYPVQICKDKGKNALALLDFRSEVNAMSLTYAALLSFTVIITNVGMQKIDRFSLATYGMVIAIFQVVHKFDCSWFFLETFLPANIKMEVILNLSFLTLSNVNV